MVEKSKKQKKGFVSEEDISNLLQRYTATTVLTLFQEVAQVTGVKIDWNALVKKTATGISNAREYQMLWRHLAYRHSLPERLDNIGEPLDDDSDLEYELEAFPAVGAEASVEATACVKVLIASGSSNDANGANGTTVEAPLTINIPNSQASRASSENSYMARIQGTNITVPVSVQKQTSGKDDGTAGGNLDTNGGNLAPKRKRKPWTQAEDEELIAAVQKCGEGNWANILKGDFKGDRTASQLSQRWQIIRKRQGNNVVVSVGNGSQLSEAQLATRRTLSLALDMPIGDNLKSASGNAGIGSHVTSVAVPPGPAETLSAGPQSQAPCKQDSASVAGQRIGLTGPSKLRVATKKPVMKTTPSPDSMVKAAAVAAGARIATPSDAASLLKAAQSKNAVRIMPGGGSLINSSVAGTSQLPSNVHFIRTGLAAKPLSNYSASPPNASRPTPQANGSSAKPSSPIIPANQENIVLGLGASSQVTNGASANLGNELEAKAGEQIMKPSIESPTNAVSNNRGFDNKAAGEIRKATIENPPRGIGQKQHAGAVCDVSSKEIGSGQTSVPPSTEQVVDEQASTSGNLSNGKADDKQTSSLNTETRDGFQEDQQSPVKDQQALSLDTEMREGILEDRHSDSANASDSPIVMQELAEDHLRPSDHTMRNASQESEDGPQKPNLPANNFQCHLPEPTPVQGDFQNMDVDVDDVKTDLNGGPGGLQSMDLDKNDVGRDTSKPESETEKGEK